MKDVKIVIFVLVLLSFSTPAQAAKPVRQNLNVMVHWGFWYGGDWGWWSSQWSASAVPDLTLVQRNLFRYPVVDTSGVPYVFNELPTTRNLVGPPSIYEVAGIEFLQLGFSVLESRWKSSSCLPGPIITLTYDGNKAQVVVSNPTTSSLHVRGMKNKKWQKWIELPPGEATLLSGKTLKIQVNTQPNAEVSSQCASFTWNDL